MSPSLPRIGDLIDIPPVETVVHLSDLASPESRARLADSFVLTDEVKSHLRRLLIALAAPHGLGCFLRGHYGAGKSHFLAFLRLLLKGEVDVVALAAAGLELAPLLPPIQARHFQVAAISLVEHSAREPLEAIVTSALESLAGPAPLPFADEASLRAHLDTFRYHLRKHQRDLLDLFRQEHNISEAELFSTDRLDLLEALAAEARYPFRPDPGRGVRFEHLFTRLEAEGYAGAVLLMDELSEFLHSKSGPALAEDVRFLQYLGELATSRPLYIVAALQEYLEAAEYGIPGELVRKIKDRYPNNLELTTTHLEELLQKRIIRHKPGADEAILAIHRDLKTWLQGFPVPAQRFLRAWPVHPATLLLLDRLKPLLSRSRGIVDFVHFRLRGSPERGLPGKLDAPADQLLTPDEIFDHFRLRIRENVEIAAFDSVVFEYYLKAAEELFPDLEVRQLALRLVKMLILLSISPEPRPYSVRTLTHALLVKVSRVDPEANFQHVRDILDKLVLEGAYVERIPATPGARPSFDDVYRLSLKADLNLVVSRRVQAAALSLEGAPDLRIFEALAPGLALDSLPLNRLLSGVQRFSTQWQRTPRDGRVSVGSLVHLDVARLMESVEELQTSDLDWALFIGVPYDLDAQRVQLQEALLPALRRQTDPSAKTILFWLPEPLSFSSSDGEFYRETLARRAVLARAREEGGTSQAQGLTELLEKAIEGDRARVEALFHQAWYKGQLETAAGPGENLSNLGRPFFEQTLLAILTPILNARFPEHSVCAPLGRPPTVDDIEAIVDRLYRPGSYAARDGDADPLASRMVSLLRPLGLTRKAGHSLQLAADVARATPIKALLQELSEQPRALKEVSLLLRKGPLGLTHGMFQLLTLGLLYAGLITAWSNGRKREAGQLSGLNFDQIQELARADMLQLDLTPLSHTPFLSESAIPRGELNFSKQESLWASLREARDKLASVLRAVKEGLATTAQYRALAGLDRTALELDVELLEPLVERLRGGNAREGIEHSLEVLSASPQARAQAERLQVAATFFTSHLERFLMIHRYLERLGSLPDGLEYVELRQLQDEVRLRLRDEALLLRGDSMEGLEAAFRRFLEGYTAVYRETHDRWKGPARFTAFDALRASPGYRLLARLSRLSSLAVDDRKGPLERKLTEATAARCQRLGSEELLAAPRCACGYALGDVVALPGVEELQQQVEEGISLWLKALGAPREREVLRTAATELAQVGRKDDAQTFRKLLDWLEDLERQATPTDGLHRLTAPDLARLEALLSDRFLGELDRTLRGVTVVEERDLTVLLNRMQDRCLPRGEAERIFRTWLDERHTTGAPADYLRFVKREGASQEGPTRLSDWLEALLQRRFAPLLLLARGMGEEKLLLGAFLARWLTERGVPPARRGAVLDRWRGEVEVPDVALELLPELAQVVRNGPRDRLEAALEASEVAAVREGLVPLLVLAAGYDGARLEGLVDRFTREDTFPSLLVEAARAMVRRLDARDDAVPALPEGLDQPGDLPGPVATPRRELGQGLIMLTRVERTLEQASSVRPKDAEAWEKLYLERLAGLPMGLETFLGAATRWGIMSAEEGAARRHRLAGHLLSLEEAFEAFYNLERVHREEGRDRKGSRGEGVDRGSLLPGPRSLAGADEALKRFARSLGDPSPTLLILDAFRWDLWQQLRPLVVRAAGGLLRIAREEVWWAGLPAIHLGADDGLGEEPTAGSAPGSDSLAFSFMGPTSGQRVRLPGVLEKVERSQESLPVLLGELTSHVWTLLRPALEALPPGRVAALYGERGFDERVSPGGKRAARYRTDGSSPFERLVPVVVIHRLGRGKA